jgi:hypothetical protein
MENNLPDWFNKQEFNNYLEERKVHGFKAAIDSQKVWIRTGRLIRDLMANTPLNRVQEAKKKVAMIKKRATNLIATRFAAAAFKDADVAGMNNPIPQKESYSDNLDSEYINFLSEAARKGSQRDVNSGTKVSPSEKARQKNITGNAKKEARDKKREQRKQERKPIGEKSKDKKGALLKGGQKDPGKFIGVRIKAGKEKGVVEIIPKADYNPNVHEVIVGSADKSGRKASLSELAKLTGDENFQATKSSEYLGISRGKGKKKKDEKKKKEENRRAKIEKEKKQQKDEEKKSSDDKKKKEKDDSPESQKKQDKKKQDEDAAASEQTSEQQPAATQQGQNVLGINAMPKPAPGAKLAVPAFSGQSTSIPALKGEQAAMISMLTRDHPVNDLLESLFGKGTKTEKGRRSRADKKIKRLQDILNEYPQLAQAGENQMRMMVGEIIAKNPAFAKYAKNMDEDDYLTEFVAIHSDLMRNCIQTSKLYENQGVSDNTAKSDVFIFPTKIAKNIFNKISSGDCNFTDEEKELIDGYSYKQGKYAAVASAQEVESAAVLESVVQTIEKFLNDPKTRQAMENAMYAGGGQNMDYLVKLRQMIVILKDINQLVQKKEYYSDRNITVRDLQDPVRGSLLRLQNPQADAQQALLKTKLAELDEVANDLIKNPIIKALILHEQLSGQGKYGDDKKANPILAGRATAVLFLNDQGDPISSMNIPETIDLLQGPNSQDANVERFYTWARNKEIRGSVKPRPTRSGMFFHPVMRTAPTAKLQDNFNIFGDGLDQLFESEFQPADINQVFTTNNLTVDPVDDIIKTMKTRDEEEQAQQPQEEEFVPYDGMSIEEYAKAVNYNFFLLLRGGGFEFADLRTNPFDAEDDGIRLSSVGSDRVTVVTYNGKEFKIPILNTESNNSDLLAYEAINDQCVQMVKDGHNLNEVMEIFSEITSDLLLEKKRNYKREYALYHGKPKQRAERSKRVLARRKMVKRHGKKALEGRDVDHKDGNAMNNGDKNLRIRSINSNRADNKHRKGEIKEQLNKKPNWWNKLTGSWEYTNFLINAVPGQENMSKDLKLFLSKNKGQSR